MFWIFVVVRRFNSSMVAGRMAKILIFKCLHRKKFSGVRLGSGFVGTIAQWKRVCHWKFCLKIPWFVLTYGHELCLVESKCVAHFCSVMWMMIMLNNEDTLHFWEHRKNFAWNFFRTCDTKIVIKSHHQHEIRSDLRHSVPKTSCKMMSERVNLHQPTVLTHCGRIYPGLCVSLYIRYEFERESE